MERAREGGGVNCRDLTLRDPGVVPELGVSLPSRAFNKWSFLASKRSSSKISAARFFFLSAMRKLDVIIFRKLKHLIEKLVLLLITYYFRKDASF